MNTFDWPTLLRVGLKNLRLTPAEFWALTPAEFALLVRDDRADGAMTRTTMDALMSQFPDTETLSDG